jgi:hypothetical protein
MSELAPAMVAYYLCRTGWNFVAWEPKVAIGDVDLRLRCPHGNLTDFQVKAPDRPGFVHDYRIVDGERDAHVLAAIDKALAQVSPSPGPQRIVVVSPQRTRTIAPKVLASHLVGRTVAEDGRVVLRSSDRGTFATSLGATVGAVVDLSLLRGELETLYRCTAFLNPWASSGSMPRDDVFKGARVCGLDGDQFVWIPEQPDGAFTLPSGTKYLAE